MPETMRLLKCPACGGPLDPPAGETTMKCHYCTNVVVIPESLRLPKQAEPSPQLGIFSGIDMNSMMGYGAHWAEVVQLAQGGNKADAVKKYRALTGNDESSANAMVDALGGYQSYQFTPGSYNSVQQIYAPLMQQTNETIKTATKMSLWLGCGITAFVVFIILIAMLPILIGVFASLLAAFR